MIRSRGPRNDMRSIALYLLVTLRKVNTMTIAPPPANGIVPAQSKRMRSVPPTTGWLESRPSETGFGRDRALIWNEQYEVMPLARYYAGLSSFRLPVQIISQIVSVIASMGAIIALLQQVAWEMMLSGVGIAGSTVVSVTWNHPSRIVMILMAGTRCRDLEIEAAELWQRLSSYDDEQTLSETGKVSQKIEPATEPVQLAGIGFSHWRNERAAADVRHEMDWAIPSEAAPKH